MRARLLSLLAAAVAAPAWAAEVNVISSVEVNDTGPEVVLTVKGSSKASFTTFSMADPPRFVIDFTESKFQGVAEEMPGAGVIQQVKALSYGANASAIARIVVSFTSDVDSPAVEDSGTSLVVRVANPGAGGVAVAATATGVDAKAKAAPDAKAKADAQAKADADAQAKADADAKAKADAQAKADADAKAKADAQAKADADAKAKADAQAKADADAKAKADAQARADADAKAKADADAKAKTAAIVGVAGAVGAAAGDEDLEQGALNAEIAAARAEARDDKQKPQPKRNVETLSPSEPEARIREVGFKQLADASRVFVRTSSPAQYSIQDVDDRTIRIQLQNARATRTNDLRFMDTSFFPSAVQMITPSREGSSYVLTVKLRQRVPYQQVKEGDMLAVDFQRPPSTAAATLPPGGAPDTRAPDQPSEE